MNRRDYLKHFSLAAAGLVASKLEVVGEASRSQKASKPAVKARRTAIVTIDSLAENFQTWPAAETPPPATPRILVSFHGLVDFFYNTSGPNMGTCGVGFHRGGGHHTPRLEIHESGTSEPIESLEINNNSELKLGIVNAANQDQTPKVDFLKDGGSRDFRRLIDMQASPWYRRSQVRPAHRAKLHVRHGTFYTMSLTKYNLQQVKVGSILPVPMGNLGKPAEEVGAAINVTGTDKVLLQVNGRDIFLPRNEQSTYKIQFSNMCETQTQNGPCDFYWWHPNEEKRNDFHYHRATLNLPGSASKLTVVLFPGQLRTGQRDPQRIRRVVTNTNDAPCMAAGYGESNGPV